MVSYKVLTEVDDKMDTVLCTILSTHSHQCETSTRDIQYDGNHYVLMLSVDNVVTTIPQPCDNLGNRLTGDVINSIMIII